MSDKNRARLGLEAFESRLTPAVSASLQPATGVLLVLSDDAGDHIAITNTTSGRTPAVNVSGVGTFLNFLNPISRIVVHGRGGDDTVDARDIRIPIEVFGGDGRDVLMGGQRNDILIGGIGDDDLYGGGGNDTLRGDAGRDGLFGGAGTDFLTGGSDPDRFLHHDLSPDAIIDKSAADATVEFRTHASNFHIGAVEWEKADWTDADIRRVDRGLGDVHRLTGTTTILELPSGANQIIYRLGNPIGPLAGVAGGASVGWNLGGSITLTEGSFPDTDHQQFNELTTAMTTVHEIAHNWHQTAHFENFVGISRWSAWWQPGLTLAFPSPLWFDATTGFARPYGRSSPLEDWATTFEAVFYGDEFNALMPGTRDDLRLVRAKMGVVENFLSRF